MRRSSSASTGSGYGLLILLPRTAPCCHSGGCSWWRTSKARRSRDGRRGSLTLAQLTGGRSRQLWFGVKLAQPVPGKVHQVSGHLLEPWFARVEPPLAGGCDHAYQHLRVDRSQAGVVTPLFEHIAEDVLDLAGDVAD